MIKLLPISTFLLATFFMASCSSESANITKVTDPDFDGDGIVNSQDLCSNSQVGWKSNRTVDRDLDGCRDLDEDNDFGEGLDSDNDGKFDSTDSCPKGTREWVRDSTTDSDDDGCQDVGVDNTESEDKDGGTGIDSDNDGESDEVDIDDDNDGIPDLSTGDEILDQCPDGDVNWKSTPNTDYDQDGCRDAGEDQDDDDDGINDFNEEGNKLDQCSSSPDNFFSNESTDHDQDGCEDDTEDLDDDNDTVNDLNTDGTILDQCPKSPNGFISKSNSDDDLDGCDDLTEDDDDGDGIFLYFDDCKSSPASFVSSSTNDYDQDGCEDDTEDLDDDNDDVNDLNADGTIFDQCPKSIKSPEGEEPFLSNEETDSDNDGCNDKTEDDEDGDGIFLFFDGCESSSPGFISGTTSDADSDGCSDIDEDVAVNTEGLIEINNETKLYYMRYNPAGTSYKTGPLDLGSVSGCPKTTGCKGYKLTNNITMTITNWEPIGDEGNPFTAIFDGDNNTISALTISRDSRYVGLFGLLEGTVKNLKLAKGLQSVNSSYRAVTGRSYAGSLAGRLNGSNALIENVSSGVNVSSIGGSNRTGGLVGEINLGTVRNSSYNGTVSGGDGNVNFVGGLAGWSFYGTIENSSSSGSVSFTGSGTTGNIGGLVGDNRNGIIRNSFSSSSVTGNDGNNRVGGLVGVNYGNITNSYSIGHSYGGLGDDSVGGLVGQNKGKITQRTGSYVAGIIRNSYATGLAKAGDGDDYSGGLVGFNTAIVINNYALGTTNGDSGVDISGGLIGRNAASIEVGTNIVKYNYVSLIMSGGQEGIVDEIGRLLGSNDATNDIASNYYNNDDAKFLIEGAETEFVLTETQAKGLSDSELKALVLGKTSTDFPDNGWNNKNWVFSNNSNYPSLKSYKVSDLGKQLEGALICNQPGNRVQC